MTSRPSRLERFRRASSTARSERPRTSAHRAVSAPGVEFASIDPRESDARTALRCYLEEMAERLGDAALGPDALDDVEEYLPPTGRFLVGRLDDVVVACGALRVLAPGIGEIKRMWVKPGARGRGLGSALLASLEDTGRALGLRVLRLDTSGVLEAALALYSSQGYLAIERYNDNPDATHFFEKLLD